MQCALVTLTALAHLFSLIQMSVPVHSHSAWTNKLIAFLLHCPISLLRQYRRQGGSAAGSLSTASSGVSPFGASS